MNPRSRQLYSLSILLLLITALNAYAVHKSYAHLVDPWPQAMLEMRTQVQSGTIKPDAAWLEIQREFPVQSDWFNQDLGVKVAASWFTKKDARLEQRAIRKVLVDIQAKFYDKRFAKYLKQEIPFDSQNWLLLYTEICNLRRRIRLTPYLETKPEIVFTKHYSLGGSHYAYTEDLSDSAYPERERSNSDYRMGAALCLLRFDEYGQAIVDTLHEAPDGVIRDPDVSYDGKRILFSARYSNSTDDFHLYEMDVATRNIRQLTDGLGYADYEGAYLPNGDILFNSTRCVQIVDCWWTDVSNFYACDKDGKHIRRVTFDQVHGNYPTVTEDGRVLYTRWDYNDRGQLFPQPLFQMNPDGTAQTEFYGNNAWFPTTIMHARGIPGTNKVLAIFSGHHSHQRGKLGILDPELGRQEAQGAQLIAPLRETPPERIDAYGQDGDQFQYPYPLDERHFLVTFSPYGGNRQYPKPFAIYFMDIDGNRELLAADPAISCSQSVPLAARQRPHERPSQVDYAKKEGTYYVQDIYSGPGLKGVARGSIQKLRVVALDFRAAGIGDNRNHGEAGGALVSTPIATGNGAWDVKTVLGEAKVHADGSAFFTVPARTPVYFQAIDKAGKVAQTMRSWSTLQPGESFSCTGCHEEKNQTPLLKKTQAMAQGPQALTPFYHATKGFSFPTYIQPILDKHCVACHNDRDAERKSTAKVVQGTPKVFSLKGDTVEDAQAGRNWSDAYLMLTNSRPGAKHTAMQGNANATVNWMSTQSRPEMLPPYFTGAAKSDLMTMLENGHGDTKLSQRERDLIACWIDLGVPYCGDYLEAAVWSKEGQEKYDKALEKRRAMEQMDQDSIASLLAME